jgi:hypothetical protein
MGRAVRAGAGFGALAAAFAIPVVSGAVPAASTLPAWASVQVPTPSNLGSRPILNAMSCPISGVCVAVGDYIMKADPADPTGSGLVAQPLVETLTNGGWKATLPPVPPLSKSTPGGGRPVIVASAALTGVSCTSATSCMAVGNYTAAPTDAAFNQFEQYAFAEELSGGHWTEISLPKPPKGQSVTMSAISCPAVVYCVAVGDYHVAAGQEGIAYTLSRTTWTVTGSVDPPGPTSRVVTLAGVSCVAIGQCVAVGSYTSDTTFVQHALAESLSGSTWRSTLTANPLTAYAASLSGVSCVSGAGCVAVGSWQGSTGSTAALVESWVRSSWIPDTTQGHGLARSLFTTVSCSGTSACEAAGDYTDGSGNEHALVDQLSGAGWQISTGIDPSGVSNPAYSAVSCPLQGSCMAIGNSRSSGNGIGLFASTEASPFASHLEVVAPKSATTGDQVTVEVFGLSAFGNPAVGYHGTLRLQSSDPLALLPAPGALDNGAGVFTVTFMTPGTHWITVHDFSNPFLASTTGPITVKRAVHVPWSPTLHVSSGFGLVGLSWTPPHGDGGYPIRAYVVLRGALKGGEAPTPLAVTTSTSFADTKTVPGSRYYYTVEALNGKGVSAPSNEMPGTLTSALSGGHRFASSWDGRGYWVNFLTGGVFEFGDAQDLGSLPGTASSAQPIVGMAPAPRGKGFWLVSANGHVFNFGDTRFYGSVASMHLSQPVEAMASTPDGMGYWLLTADGRVWNFGDAPNLGSLAAPPRQPVVAMAISPDGRGYLLASADGQVFAFGDAHNYGSINGVHLAQPINGIAASPDGRGYYLVGYDGAVFTFGDATNYGGLSRQIIMWPIVGIRVEGSGKGYDLIDTVGTARHFGS